MGKKKSQGLAVRNRIAEFLVFTRQAGEEGMEVRYGEESIWSSQKLMAELFNVRVRGGVSTPLSSQSRAGATDAHGSSYRRFAQVA